MILSNYDRWKLATPWDDIPEEPNGYSIFYCDACEDCGWLNDNDHAVPCTECSKELTMDDIEEIATWVR